MNILDLPEENLLEIFSYITFVEDLLRFEVACKRFKSLSFEVARDLYITDNEPFEVIKNLLSRDLRHLRKLEFLSPELEEDETDWIIDRLTILSALHNLKQLNLKFEYNSCNQQEWRQKFSDLRLTFQKMTWLEKLEYQYPIIDDLGEVLANHAKLTRLVITDLTLQGLIEVPCRVSGFKKLTQVKYLALPIDTLDVTFNEVIQLTNLIALDMGFANISVGMGKNLTRLTNLEKINISGLDREVVNWKLLRSLPKLTSLIDDGDNTTASDEEFMELNQMTQLTHLEVTYDWLATEKMSNLTNLQVLTCCMEGKAGNFAIFDKLTYLSVYGTQVLASQDQIQLPQSLKSLDIPMHTSSDIFTMIITIQSLESLSVKCYQVSNAAQLQISRLTNLKFLEFMNDLSPGIGKSLQALPMLRKLRLHTLQEQDIAELQAVSQLNQLEIFRCQDELPLTTLRPKFPFAVYEYHK